MMNWHNVQDKLPIDNIEVIVRLDGCIFEYQIAVYYNGEWKSLNGIVNQANVKEWSYII